MGLSFSMWIWNAYNIFLQLDLLKLEHDKMKKVGDWNPIQGLNITDPYAFLQGNKTGYDC